MAHLHDEQVLIVTSLFAIHCTVSLAIGTRGLCRLRQLSRDGQQRIGGSLFSERPQQVVWLFGLHMTLGSLSGGILVAVMWITFSQPYGKSEKIRELVAHSVLCSCLVWSILTDVSVTVFPTLRNVKIT